MLLGGCAGNKNIYYWENYQSNIYQYYQKEKTSPEEQIASLKESVEKSRAQDKSVPPGLHAQMGLLYVNTGNGVEALREFETEKELFPESAQFMDYLLSKNKGNKK